MSEYNVNDRFDTKDLLKKPGEGERTATDMIIMARSRDMGGDFSVMQGVINPGHLLSPHSHKFCDQLVYVISSELVFEIGGADGLRFTAPAGSYVQKPRGIVHAFWNSTDTPAHYIELSGQETFEGFVDSLKGGDRKGVANAERDWGMVFALDEIPRLIKDNNLTGLAMSETPDLPNLPNLPEPVAKLFSNMKLR
ncbi:MAG: cupin domain-containing protein [Moorea sp. SIOASIH]|uniref:cupin domain-containing protein n=1 Tax=Moorena sp. SIOASIH TaxID=2607817 RepID=UPI0013BBEBAE|nr:cupin domain-containing protein [Moorena sp. SIOASIH]NEO39365.1 cupin domain-containing protein [Moorena sp. SIOASIH]